MGHLRAARWRLDTGATARDHVGGTNGRRGSFTGTPVDRSLRSDVLFIGPAGKGRALCSNLIFIVVPRQGACVRQCLRPSVGAKPVHYARQRKRFRHVARCTDLARAVPDILAGEPVALAASYTFGLAKEGRQRRPFSWKHLLSLVVLVWLPTDVQNLERRARFKMTGHIDAGLAGNAFAFR